MKYRIQMNATDSKANTQAIDSLINYETVKYFGNERHELERYNTSLEEWEDAAVKSQTSMSALNVGQAGIIAIGVTLIMILAAKGVVAGTLTIGDLVLINAFLSAAVYTTQFSRHRLQPVETCHRRHARNV